jgi:hypothetical protein
MIRFQDRMMKTKHSGDTEMRSILYRKQLVLLAGMCMMALCLMGIGPTAAQAEQPPFQDAMWGRPSPLQYTILPRPATKHNRQDPNTYKAPPTQITSKPSEPYAYGWFGGTPSPHWHRQFGHQNAYTQWTLR